jgi:hypothetical protein
MKEKVMNKFKSVLHVLVLLVVLFGSAGSFQHAFAQTETPAIVERDLTFWDATYTGYVDVNRYERWPLELSQTENFSVTAAPTAGGLTTLVILKDQNDVEITRGTGTLVTSQPAGNYFIYIQPETGGGFYTLTIRRVDVTPTEPSSTVTATPSNLRVGETATVSVSLDNIPEGGYTSAEFVCSYDAAMIEVGDIVITDLFGLDSASAINGPANGSFIVAIAGSNGNRATQDGVAFTFSATALQAGTTTITCVVRVSQGDNVLTEIPSTSATLTITDVVPEGTLTGQVIAGKTVTVNLYDSTDALVASTTADEQGLFTITASAGTYTVGASALGFLAAEGPATIAADETSTKATVTLLAGDIDGNNVIDQFDAMTIGMSYNGSSPEAADLNDDGNINVLDLELLAANYRATGPIDWP